MTATLGRSAVQGVDYRLESVGGRVQLVAEYDAARRSREQRERVSEVAAALDTALYGSTDVREDVWLPGETDRAITGWSAKSRRNLLRSLAGRRIVGRYGLVTLTLPGDWRRYAPDPATFKAAFKALQRRWDREFGTWVGGVLVSGGFRGCAKLEFQRRGAPHLHVVCDMPAGVSAREMRAWVREAWHSLVVHQGARCDRATCSEVAHVFHGTDVNMTWADRIWSAGKSCAAYFAKHGVWSTKAHQNELPFTLGGIPEPTFDGRYYTYSFGGPADPWARPGRWWWFIRLPESEPRVDDLTPAEAECVSLVVRKVFTRRTTRYVERSGARPALVRRSLRSARSTLGWWILASTDGVSLASWLLDRARALAELPPGVLRARALVGLTEPGGLPPPWLPLGARRRVAVPLG